MKPGAAIIRVTQVRLDEISVAELRERANVGAGGAYTKLYLGIADDEQVALLVVDFWPPPNLLVIYEVFVATSARRRGIATRLLAHAEVLATAAGNPGVALRAKSLDPSITTTTLVA